MFVIASHKLPDFSSLSPISTASIVPSTCCTHWSGASQEAPGWHWMPLQILTRQKGHGHLTSASCHRSINSSSSGDTGDALNSNGCALAGPSSLLLHNGAQYLVKQSPSRFWKLLTRTSRPRLRRPVLKLGWQCRGIRQGLLLSILLRKVD